jgi:hypothetical protein
MDSGRLIACNSGSDSARSHEEHTDFTLTSDQISLAERGLALPATIDDGTEASIYTGLPGGGLVVSPDPRGADGHRLPPALDPLPKGQGPDPGRLLCPRPR